MTTDKGENHTHTHTHTHKQTYIKKTTIYSNLNSNEKTENDYKFKAQYKKKKL